MFVFGEIKFLYRFHTMQILAVCLLYEMGKGKSSWWHPYLMNLPRRYDILATFGEFEKQALQVQLHSACLLFCVFPFVVGI